MTPKEQTTESQQQYKIDCLKQQLDEVKKSALVLEATIRDMKNHLSMHCYESHDNAEAQISGDLEIEAYRGCEGSYKCGADTYEQDYTISGSEDVFTGVLKVEYNRYDKIYYYIDGIEYSYKEKEPK